MKKSMFTISIIVSLTTLAVFVIGWIMQAQKTDIDTMPVERFDLIMNIYKIGNILITISIYLAFVAIVSWIATAIIGIKK